MRIAVFDVERRSAGIDVLGDEVPAVVGQRAFAAHGGDGSFHGASFLVRGWVAGGSVTLVKSNVKALLTLRIKSALALSEGERGCDAGWACSRWRTALTPGTGACHAPVSGGE